MSFFHRDPKESATQEKVAKKPKVLSGDSTVAEWLDHPVGGVIFRDMLHKAGQNENVLRIVRRLSLSRLIDMSKGQFTKEMLDDMVQKANAGEVPEGIEAAPATTSSSEHVTEPLPEWHETITPERFAGKTIIVTGAGSGIGRATASRVAR